MKRTKHFFTIVSFVGLIFFSSITVYAKDLEQCRLCNGSGAYYCVRCNNAGTVVCDGCGGNGGNKCEGDTYKGNSCDNGYYVCKSCNGDGQRRNGDGDIVDGVCGNCNGAGKLPCVACSNGTLGWKNCTRCYGAGVASCQSCTTSRAIGYKCPKCTGTGYVLVANPMPPESDNDGIKNVPQNGDRIVINEKANYYFYGQSAEKIYALETDFETMEQEQSNGNESVPSNKVEVEPETEKTSYAAVEIGKMSNEEKTYYVSLDEEELNRKLANVQQIVASAQPGMFEEGTEEIIYNIAEQNGYNTLQEGRILPLYFEGHEDLGFPIAVRVYLEKGVLDGGTELYIYHIADDQTIESLGKAEYCTYDDGSVESILFYTTGFSTFFTASFEVNTIIPVISDSSETTVENNIDEVVATEVENATSYIVWIVVAGVLLIFVARVIVRKYM